MEHFPEKPITLCGFSFGARVGLEVGVSDDRVVNLISIGTPVDKYDFSFLEACRKPILFVHGELDEFGDLNVKITCRSDRKQLSVTPLFKTRPFFEGHLDELKRAITDWIKRQQA